MEGTKGEGLDDQMTGRGKWERVLNVGKARIGGKEDRQEEGIVGEYMEIINRRKIELNKMSM